MVGLDKSFDKLIQSDDGSIVTKVNLDHKSDFGIMKNEGNEFFPIWVSEGDRTNGRGKIILSASTITPLQNSAKSITCLTLI